MDKQEVLLLAQLIKTLESIVNEMSHAEQTSDIEKFEQLKKEALELQKKIEGIL